MSVSFMFTDLLQSFWRFSMAISLLQTVHEVFSVLIELANIIRLLTDCNQR